jgi:hypothetical protein
MVLGGPHGPLLRQRVQVRPKKVGHAMEPPQQSRFYVQLAEIDLYSLVIPREFRQQLKGGIPRPLRIKCRLGCAWSMHIEDISGELVFKEDWYDFALEHEL